MRKSLLLGFSLIFFLWSSTCATAVINPPKLIIAIDASRSMEGINNLAMKKAVIDLVKDPSSKYQVTLYTFGRKLSLLAVTEDDKAAVLEKIRKISSSGYTALYDSIIQAVSLVNNPDDRIIFLTDGKDSVSQANIDEVKKDLIASKAKIDFFVNQVGNQELEGLQSIATVASGRVYVVNQTNIFLDELKKSLNELSISLKNSPNEVPHSETTPYLFFISTAVGGISLFTLSTLRTISRRRNLRSIWSDSMELYEPIVKRSRSLSVSVGDDSKIERLANKVLGDLSPLFPPGKNRFLRFGILALLASLIATTLWSLGIPLIVIALFTPLFVVWIIRKLLESKSRRVIRDFEADLPNALKMLAAGLGSGLSFLQALESLSSNLNSEVNRQFHRALREIQMGTPIEKALMSVAERMKSKDLEWAVFAFNVQREVGGSLSRILQTTAESIESRTNIRREIRTLSAEGRLSIYVLMFLPVVVLLFFSLVRPDFLKVFWNNSLGNLLLLTVIALIAMSWFWMKKIIRIEV